MLDNVRVAARSLVRSRTLSAVLLISLALGTGANVAVFGLVHRLLFSAPSGVRGANRLADIYTSRYDGAAYGPSSYADFLSLMNAAKQFESVAASDDQTHADVSLGETRWRIRTAAVSPDYFGVLRMQPLRGRLLAAADAGAMPPRVVISSTLWDELGRGDDTIGRSLQIGATDHIIVGVAAMGFRGLRTGRATDAWVLLAPELAQTSRGDRGLSIIGRLKPGARFDHARTELHTIDTRLAEQFPETNRGTAGGPGEPRLFTASRYSQLDPETREQAALVSTVIIAAVVLLLASACVNAGSLLLSRAMARRREIAVKKALGASRGLLVRQLLAETLLIAIAGTTLGLLFAVWTLEAIPSLFAPEQAALLDTRLDFWQIAMAVAASVAAGALFGLVPAIQGTAEAPTLALRGDSGEISEAQGGSSRLRAVLVVAQLAVSVVLMIGAGLLATSVDTALQGDLGFTARNVAAFSHKSPATADHQRAVANAFKDVKGVSHIVWASAPPLTRGASRQYRIETGDAGVVEAVELNVNVVSPRYFEAIELPIVEGRAFSAADHGLADPVVIVDEALARRYFGPEAVGRTLIDSEGTALEIVGVVRSGRYRTLQESPQPTVYYSTSQEHIVRGYVLVRTTADPEPMLEAFNRRLINAGLAVERKSTLQRRMAETLALDRLVTALVGVCGLIALILATIGVYGTISDAVRRRTREIGLRMALGAGRAQVVRLVLAEAMYLTVGGMAAGIAGAVALWYVAGTAVHGVPRIDATSIAATPGVLALVVGLAAVLPLRRALRVSPTIALRAE